MAIDIEKIEIVKTERLFHLMSADQILGEPLPLAAPLYEAVGAWHSKRPVHVYHFDDENGVTVNGDPLLPVECSHPYDWGSDASKAGIEALTKAICFFELGIGAPDWFNPVAFMLRQIKNETITSLHIAAVVYATQKTKP